MEHGLYRVAISRQGWDEVTRNLVRTGRVTPGGAARLDTQILRFLAEHDALVTAYEGRIPTLTNHPKDRHVLAAAITAGAAVIVTFNLRDFPRTALAPYGITAEHPDTFLAHVFDDQADVFGTLVRAQSAALRSPPVSVDRVLQALAQHIPRTVTRFQDHV